MKDNQGKTPKQNKDSNTFTFIGYIGIVIVVTVSLLFMGNYTGFNKEVQEGIKNDPRPTSNLMNYLPPSFYDTLTSQDSMEIKDPSTIYYDTTGSPCIDDNDSMMYLDEHVMWIGGNGDTIWE